MAGNTNILKSSWPFGEDGVLCFQSGDVNIEASKTNWEWDIIKIPYKFKPIRVEIISQSVSITNAITIDVADDESTPQVMVDDEALSAITAGSVTASDIITATIDDEGPFLATGGLIFRYTSGASDTSVGTRVRIWHRPVYT